MLFASVLYSGTPSVHNSVTTCSGGYVFNKNSTVESTLGLSTGLLLAAIWQTIKANRSLKSSSCKCVKGSTTCSPSEKSKAIPQAPDPESSRRAALSPRLPLSLLASESDLSHPPARRETTPLPFYRMQQNDALVCAQIRSSIAFHQICHSEIRRRLPVEGSQLQISPRAYSRAPAAGFMQESFAT
jgi:hypothetical protein